MKRIALLLASFVPALLLLLLFAPRAPVASSFEGLLFEGQVVRAWFDDPAIVAQLAAWNEPWEVNRDKGYLVVDASADEVAWLTGLGFRVEVDQALTDFYRRATGAKPQEGGGIPGYPCYRTVEETFATAEALVASYPQLASWIDIGDSWEKSVNPSNGYDMQVLRLTNSATPGPKPGVFIMSALHAREYTTAELNTRFAELLLTGYGIDPDITWLLDYHVFHLLLQSNPDGRKQAETGLSWRKNTNQNYCGPTSTSRGADLNRNFEFQWGCCGGSSGSQCSLTYRGPSPASEPETQAIQNYVRSVFPDLREDPLTSPAPVTTTGVFLDIHSYSELVLWPWGFTAQTAPNGVALQTLGRKLAWFNNYYPEQAIGLYPTDGTTEDFGYGELGLPAYTYELGTAFFQSCSTFENTILPDNMPSLVYLGKAARAPYLIPAGPDVTSVTAAPAAVAPGALVTLTAVLDDTRFNNQNGTEPVQPIAQAEYYLNVPDWVTTTTPIPFAMAPADGSFNTSVETAVATIDTTGLPPGRHTIFVRGQDSAGNWGTVSAAFLYIIDPAVAPIIEGAVTQAGTNLPLAATVTANGTFQTSTDPSTGYYQMQVISGTYSLTAAAADHLPQTITGVNAQDYQTVTQDFSLESVCTAFLDDVEGGNIGWTADPPWAITTEKAYSPIHSWTDSPGGNYSNSRNISLTSPLFDLTGITNLTLEFAQICNTEAGYDYCNVEVSTNGGSSWTLLTRFDGPSTNWEQISLDASLLDNQSNARIRFRLSTDFSVTADGWHIDDIALRHTGASCQPTPVPVASFSSSSPDSLGETTVFTNTSQFAVSYAWDFGDGSAGSTAVHPTHQYAAVGSYTVTLTATNALSQTNVVTGTVVINPPALVAGFTSSSPDYLGMTTVFTNTSTGALTYEWEFGDGSPVSTAVNPTHTYAAPGVYTVTLTARHGAFSDSITGAVFIWLGDTYLPAILRP